MRGFRYARIAYRRLFSTSSGGVVRHNVLDELESRGFVAATTSPSLRQHVAMPTCVYAGIDPSAPSLHVGNLLPLMGLLHFHLAGHQVIALVGGATGSIGDPSGRSTERPILSPAELERNVAGITAQIHQFFSRGEELAAKVNVDKEASHRGAGHNGNQLVKVLNNLEWFGQMSLLDFLRGTGKSARVSAMLSKESVKTRLVDGGISFTEFSYQLLQAHDFSVLNDQHGCRIQLGGSDQWGNIVAGIDLINRQRKLASTPVTDSTQVETPEEVFGLTLPLLTTASGEKFGKSAGNAVWLDSEKTSISDLYQFFYRQPDSMIETYLNTLTLLPRSDIETVLAVHQAAPQERSAQKLLAEQVTQLIHGSGALERSLQAADLLFRIPLAEWRSAEVLEVFAGDPRFRRVSWDAVKEIPLRSIMADYGLAKSPNAAAKACRDGAVTVNDSGVVDHRLPLPVEEAIDRHLFIVRMGKKETLVLYVE